MISGASNIAEYADRAFLIIIGICIALLVLITVIMVYFVIKYHRKRNAEPRDIEGNLFIEIAWTVIPTIIVLIMFYYGWTGFRVARDIPDDALGVKVSARKWSWRFEYENGRKTDTLYVPLNKPVKLTLTSQDVIHSLYIPAFRIKEDAVPGMTTAMWFKATKEGKYDILCAEYCGRLHSKMLSKVVVMGYDAFEHWYGVEEGKEETEANLVKGKELLDENGCLDCHSLDGTAEVCTSFKGLYGSKRVVLTDGKERTIVADEAYIKKSILKPDADVVKGFEAVMPSFEDEIGGKDISAIISYLKTQ